MKFSLKILVLLLVCACNTSNIPYIKEIKAVQEKLRLEYLDPKTSPLPESEIEDFKAKGGIVFYPIDTSFNVLGRLEKTNSQDTIFMPTSSEKMKSFYKYGVVYFQLKGKKHELAIYQSHQSMNSPEYKNYLFLPFKDLTSGKNTYGGGRYLDILIPKSDSIQIDFNKAYHPYCAYTIGYSCPIPPAENFVNLPITAGVKLNLAK